MTAARKARLLLRRTQYGVLSTLSQRCDGHPFGSIAGFVLDAAACPVILISALAEHTRNLRADPRVSLLSHEAADDWQAGGRVTVMGEAQPCAEDAALRARYLRYFPQAADYFAAHDFSFYRILPARVRFIGGFGDIHWIAGTDFTPPPAPLAAQETAILDHMNADHRHNLLAYCRHYHGRTVTDAEMTGIDCDGFNVRADGELLRFDFDAEISDAAQARAALVQMAKAAQ